jgi:hypothetical protein
VSAVAVILYEDQRGPQREFGLHNLILVCVADELGGDVFSLGLGTKLDGRPMKGVNNVLKSCRKDVQRLSPRGQRVFALIDADEIRTHLKHEGLLPNADDAAVIRAIKAPGKCVAPDQLEVILLKENTETIIETVRICGAGVSVDLALQKDINARDRVLNHVAWASGRAVRDCIRGRVAALDKLVVELSALVRAGS